MTKWGIDCKELAKYPSAIRSTKIKEAFQDFVDTMLADGVPFHDIIMAQEGSVRDLQAKKHRDRIRESQVQRQTELFP